MVHLSGASPDHVRLTRPGTRLQADARAAGPPPLRVHPAPRQVAGRVLAHPLPPSPGWRRCASCQRPRTQSGTTPAQPVQTAGSRSRHRATGSARGRQAFRHPLVRQALFLSPQPAPPGRPNTPRPVAPADPRSAGTQHSAQHLPAGSPPVAPPPAARPRAPSLCPLPPKHAASRRGDTCRASEGPPQRLSSYP